MELEKEIRQINKFTSAYHKLSVNILYTASWLSAIHARQLKPFDLTPQQFNILRILRGSHPNPMRLTDVSDRMIEKNSNCTRLVEKLRIKKLVNREINPSNRRQVHISITPSGLKVLSEIDREYNQWLVMLHGISEVEAKELNRILDKLRG